MLMTDYAAGRQGIVKHVGSAHTKADLRVLPVQARELLEDPVQGLPDLAVAPKPVRNDAVQARLTIVLTALSVLREAQNRTALVIRNVLRRLRPLRSATVAISTTSQTFPPEFPADKHAILEAIHRGSLTHSRHMAAAGECGGVWGQSVSGLCGTAVTRVAYVRRWSAWHRTHPTVRPRTGQHLRRGASRV